MNTNSMQPKVIFIYSLPKNKVAEMEQKRFNYSLFISKIQGIEGVEVHELCEDFFSTTHKCQILIVLGEYLGDEQALLLHDDSLFPLDELINKISISSNGVEVIDMAFCYSGEWREKLKKITNALVNGNNEKTQVEARLQLYPLLLLRKDLGRENYKESYDIILDKLEKKQNRRNPQELANLPESTKLGTMSTSAVPKEVYRNSPFPVKVYIHADGDKVDIVAEIDGYRPHTISNLKLNNGDKISWELCFDTNPKPEYAQYLEHIKGERSYFDTWNSDEPEIRRTFYFFVEEAFPLNGFNGVLKTIIGENKLDEWPFTVNVLPYKDDKAIYKVLSLEQQAKVGEYLCSRERQKGKTYIPRAGRPPESMFLKEEDKMIWASEFKKFLKEHQDHSQGFIEARRYNYESLVFAFFYIRWKQMKIVPESPNGAACFRFLTDDCKISNHTPQKQYGDFIRDKINDFFRNKIKGKQNTSEEEIEKTQKVDVEVNDWFSHIDKLK